MSTGLLLFWGAIAVIALLGVIEIIRKGRRGPRRCQGRTRPPPAPLFPSPIRLEIPAQALYL